MQQLLTHQKQPIWARILRTARGTESGRRYTEAEVVVVVVVVVAAAAAAAAASFLR